MGVETAFINAAVLERLTRLNAQGLLAHAYLFSGPQGIGKVATAFAVAKAVNCLALGGFVSGCVCASCHKIDAGNHPDLFLIEKPADKTGIVIGQITHREGESCRPLIPWLGVRALEARVRVIIIKDADLFSTQAANAFLKTLEEPRPGTLLILTTSAPGSMLPTVSSRCHEVRFFPPGHSFLAGRLESEYDIPPVQAEVLSRFSGGSLGHAVALGMDFIKRRDMYINEFILGPCSDAMLKKYSADRDEARVLCDVVLSFYRDVLCVKNGSGRELLCHQDRVVDIERAATRMTAEDIDRVIMFTLKAIEAAGDVFNMKLALTVLKENIL